jgi:hypothetical protein
VVVTLEGIKVTLTDKVTNIVAYAVLRIRCKVTARNIVKKAITEVEATACRVTYARLLSRKSSL